MGITKRKIRKLDAIARAKHPEGHKAQRAYSAKPFVLCGIPVRRPNKHSLEYSRQNGRFRLRVIGYPDYGLPFGQDRLLLIWIASMATWQKNRAIRFRSAATILETFGLPKDVRYYKRLITGFEKIFYSTFFFTSDEQDAESVIITRNSFRFVSTLKLWYIRRTPSDEHRESIPRENIAMVRLSRNPQKRRTARKRSDFCGNGSTLGTTAPYPKPSRVRDSPLVSGPTGSLKGGRNLPSDRRTPMHKT